LCHEHPGLFEACPSLLLSPGPVFSCGGGAAKLLQSIGDIQATNVRHAIATVFVQQLIVRIKPREPDAIEVRLVQLKSGGGGLTGAEITRLKRAVAQLSTDWLLAAFDGQTLHLVPDIPARGKRSA